MQKYAVGREMLHRVKIYGQSEHLLNVWGSVMTPFVYDSDPDSGVHIEAGVWRAGRLGRRGLD